MTIDQIAALATAVIKDKKNRILFLKRSHKNKTFKHYWQLPEGKIELNESPADTLSRELQEEVGADYKPTTLTLHRIVPIVVRVQGITFLLIKSIFLAPPSPRISLSGDHSQFSWFSLSNASTTLKVVPGTKEVLKTL